MMRRRLAQSALAGQADLDGSGDGGHVVVLAGPDS